ncbi:MAG: MFS transporter [Limnothrix sp.]
MSKIFSLFTCLKNTIFARLYLAQTINLVGDALTWLGLALLAFEIAGEQSGQILAGALTLRVTAYVILSPIAGVIADRFDRKKIMVITHLMRMAIVSFFPFVNQAWQIYGIVLGLNIFAAFFTPTYTATIPLVTGEREYPQAIALSSATYQLLGVLGPGLAGSMAAFVGTRSIFFLDGATFFIAAILLMTLPVQLLVNHEKPSQKTLHKTLEDIKAGSLCLWADPQIRYALLMQLVAAIAGAEVLVNTVSYVQGSLSLGKVEYGWVMAAFGMGATLTSVGISYLQNHFQKMTLVTIGASLITLALVPASFVGFQSLLLLWLLAGIGQTLVNVPTQTLIADRVAVEVQGRVYGAHFAWSHFWWAFAYPLAGWLGTHSNSAFLLSSILGSIGLVCFVLTVRPTLITQGLWHEHDHHHDQSHDHHSKFYGVNYEHSHLHFH